MTDLKLLLVGIDFSPRSHTAAEMAVTLARPIDAQVKLLHVVEVLPSEREARILGLSVERVRKALVHEAQSELSDLAKGLNYDRIETSVVMGRAAEELANRAESRKAGLLVVGDTGALSTQRRRGLGTTAYRLMEKGPKRVLIAKPSYHGKLDRIAAAVDLSPVSDEVLDQAIALSRIVGAKLFVVHAYSTVCLRRLRSSYSELLYEQAMCELKNDSETRLARLAELHQTDGVSLCPIVLPGSPGTALTEFLHDTRIDMVVVGTGTSPRIAGFPIGSTTHKVANETTASVLIVRSRD